MATPPFYCHYYFDAMPLFSCRHYFAPLRRRFIIFHFDDATCRHYFRLPLLITADAFAHAIGCRYCVVAATPATPAAP